MPTPLGLTKAGALEADTIQALEYQLFGSAVPIVLTNPTAATDMMTYTFPAGIMNVINKGFTVFAGGVYNLGLASTLVFTVKLGGVTIATFTSGSNATTGVTLQWNLYLQGTTVTTGPAGSMEVHGELNINIGATLAAAITTYLDSNTAALTGINFQSGLLLEVMSNLGSGNAGSSITQRQEQVEIYG